MTGPDTIDADRPEAAAPAETARTPGGTLGSAQREKAVWTSEFGIQGEPNNPLASAETLNRKPRLLPG